MKVFPFKIPKAKEEAIIYQFDKELILYDKLHQHEEIQISYIEKGEGTIIVGDTISEYNAGDIIVFGSNLPHVFKSEINKEEELSLVHSIFFDATVIKDSLQVLPESTQILNFFEDTRNGYKVLSKKEKIYSIILDLSTAKDTTKFIKFLQLLNKLTVSKKKSLSSFRYNKDITDSEGKRMQVVYEFVMNNFDKKISLEEIANIANMTKNAFCRYFKVRTNKTFFQFLIELRIEKASRILTSNHEISIVEIAELTGFNNISNFNRKFKEIKKISPMNYRKRFKN
ncbi:AraC family transcriptional regulator [Flavobacterium columnare NBRC 100251 = ATCC 23463]|uniref:AraC family transcriptional regulator n=1 Tax=Flavobacterium columnare (strain ATCC 49512 / CIP 103533 / TG 44/87) TaxID=1041826 RepID=G8X6B6_FLACA|nr:AraC family transcriptional regulator [Flavobacterium columnare]AEW86957.1 AraC family transcriptional regulator [Flavobacterium columnare ATCC 49512]ANO47725.1 AraC family transcriptional regulator [Flavobacterium columnare]APT21660.1 AraC family transcriptional regulator [Flavobacterium columnare]MBF6652145.1 AraC family transcriptional regulator [Flavobacterium columnare]MBF6655143.1 AraC family transcriptional regulator [Flavobacterium columnare]